MKQQKTTWSEALASALELKRSIDFLEAALKGEPPTGEMSDFFKKMFGGK